MASLVLRRVGWALVVVGALDIGFMVYCILNQMNYRSSFNIFAVIAGILLLRQSLKTARIVAWFSAFLLTGFTGAAILFPFLAPLDLWGTQLRLSPFLTVSTVVVGIAAIAFVFWVYHSLTSQVVLDARRSVGMDSKKPLAPFAVGAVLVIGLFVLLAVVSNGEAAQKAVLKAQEKLGPGYKYHVTSLRWSDSGGRATLTAYNRNEIKEVQVQW